MNQAERAYLAVLHATVMKILIDADDHPSRVKLAAAWRWLGAKDSAEATENKR